MINRFDDSSNPYHSYRAFKGARFKRDYQVYNAKESADHLHQLQTVLSNAKSLVGGTFH